MTTKALVTLNIDYNEKIIALTLPFLKAYANKIGAEFIQITQRKFPTHRPNYEKFQCYEIAKHYDWTIFIDIDAYITYETPDLTELLPDKSYVMMHNYDMSSLRFKIDPFMQRDKRFIGACTWLVVCSNWTRDIWRPMEIDGEITEQEALANIQCLTLEKNFGMTSDHLLDDYLVSRNIARYGLKVKSFERELAPKFRINGLAFFNHIYTENVQNKEKFLQERITAFKREYLSHFKYNSLEEYQLANGVDPIE